QSRAVHWCLRRLRKAGAIAGRQVSARNAYDLRRMVVKARRRKEMDRPACHNWQVRYPDCAAEWQSQMPLLRQLRTWMHHLLIFQQPWLDPARCREDRPDGTQAPLGSESYNRGY